MAFKLAVRGSRWSSVHCKIIIDIISIVEYDEVSSAYDDLSQVLSIDE